MIKMSEDHMRMSAMFFTSEGACRWILHGLGGLFAQGLVET